MKPVIGVTPSVENASNMHFVSIANITAIEGAGGTPIILPFVPSETHIRQIAGLIDGLYLTGGNSIDPTLFVEEPHPKLGEINPIRDQYEVALIQEIQKHQKPILGVCRGCQILNIALGGDMYQDIYAQMEGELLQHKQHAPDGHASHYVYVEEGSVLREIAGKEKIKVNSRHHQANRKLGGGMQICGMASDGVVEAIESREASFLLGVQWHPENLAIEEDAVSKNIFHAFIEACRERS
ncbi:gamma-glutamyl-gamma-aminobutyrate hydrolase [Virgibacillus dokdonensis]|uniref:Gamma-glutamyl-gamma-aminobutyrate hydrolase n=1 Tax=Virgibacillus dokdonensis TaxID=302167 RepID=A0A3E0WN95_9BACI|nr:gamma-glutamyl-gamma-aminobutyrate hydrolase family protein [Virgibacillus dokdonensis]RFA33621.1 gamma-glutamyl-gamma-aminobutyrate hydrolase [Virgibacillus dokdonensis]